MDIDTLFVPLCIIGVIFIIFFTVVALILSFSRAVNDVKRMQALEGVAKQMGFIFHSVDDGSFRQSLPEFQLLSQGSSGVLSNLMYGTLGEMTTAVFDYQYSVPSGKHSKMYRQTVVCLETPGVLLPTFNLQPENTLHKIGSWFGLQDIDFPNHSIFSARYLLQGTDEQAIRVHFTKDVIDYLESTTDLYVEANIRHLLIYQRSVLMAPKDIQAFAEAGVRLLSLFTCGIEEH